MNILSLYTINSTEYINMCFEKKFALWTDKCNQIMYTIYLLITSSLHTLIHINSCLMTSKVLMIGF